MTTTTVAEIVKPADIPLVCPNCGDAEAIESIETIQGCAGARVSATGEVDWCGDTRMLWDTSTTIGWRCRNCDWEVEGLPDGPETDPVNVLARGKVPLCVSCLDRVGLSNECEDGCNQPLNHQGTCHGGETACAACDVSDVFLRMVEVTS